MSTTSNRRSGSIVGAIAVIGVLLLGACGTEAEAQTATLTWWINPDSGGQERIAQECSEASDGSYTIRTNLLPRDAPGQREQLIRRLAGGDTSIDLMSLDPPYIPEVAQAGFLAEVPDDVEAAVTEDVVEGALKGSTWADELVTLPFWANTQLLWYRQSVAEEAGLDMSEPVTWEQIIQAAEQTGKLVGVQGTRAESITVWINALITSAGGEILENPQAEVTDYQLGLASDAGVAAAEVISTIAETGVGGAQLPTSTEDINATQFESENGGFMVNWPFVWPRGKSYVEASTMTEETLDDYGWALYPRVHEGEPARPPYGGINIGVSALSENVDLAFDAGQCIVAVENQIAYFLSDGNPPSNAAAYDDAEVLEQFPMADLIRESLENAAPRPQSPYYNEISFGLQRTWQPPSTVEPESTPEESQELIIDVLRGEALL